VESEHLVAIVLAWVVEALQVGERPGDPKDPVRRWCADPAQVDGAAACRHCFGLRQIGPAQLGGGDVAVEPPRRVGQPVPGTVVGRRHPSGRNVAHLPMRRSREPHDPATPRNDYLAVVQRLTQHPQHGTGELGGICT
jgi:hypothetical protein